MLEEAVVCGWFMFYCQVRASSKFLTNCTSLVGSGVIPLLRFCRILLETASFLQHLQFLDFLWDPRFRVIRTKGGFTAPLVAPGVGGRGFYLRDLRGDDAGVFLSLAQRGHVSQKLSPLLDLTQNCRRKSGIKCLNRRNRLSRTIHTLLKPVPVLRVRVWTPA